jgi:hypothetical protein
MYAVGGITGSPQKGERFALRIEDVNACQFNGARRRVNVSLLIHGHAVDPPAIGAEIEQHFLVGQSLIGDVESDQLMVALRIAVIVRDVDRVSVARNNNAVGFLHIARGQTDFTLRIDDEDAFEIQFPFLISAVARIGEIDIASQIDGQVVGAIEAPPLIAIGERFHGTVALGDRDAAIAASRAFAGQ